MPQVKKNRIGVMVYLMPDTYRALADIRSPYISASAQYAMILEEVVASNTAAPNQGE